ncbi:MAG: ComEC/Rec2 family competence protein [Candidatus Levyibacteriota bacterium]
MRVLILSCTILLLILGIRYVLYFQSLKTYRVGDVLKREITLLTEPKVSSYYQTFKIDSITVEAPTYPEFHYGDTLLIQGNVEDGSFQAANGKVVSRLAIKNPQITLQKTNFLVGSAAYFRNRIEETFNAYLPKNEAVLLFGVVFGGSQGFSQDYYQAFKNAGVLHVIAASGMNVTMVAAFLISFLSLFLKRQVALGMAASGIFYYALLSGFQASILRAGIMAGIAFGAGMLGRQNYAFFGLLLTAYIMLFIKPETMFDVGFLLSFSATFGILTVKPLLDPIWIIKKTKGFSDDITTSVSAQIGSIPVMVGAFGAYSVISILVNALVLWTIPLLMILGGIAALCAITVPFVSVVFLYLSYPLLLYFEKVVLFFGKIPMIQLDNIPIVLWIGYYLILVSIILWLKKVKHS